MATDWQQANIRQQMAEQYAHSVAYLYGTQNAYRPTPEDREHAARLDRRTKPIPHIERLAYSGAISG